MSIYISSACITESDLGKNLSELSRMGYPHVELTGGIAYLEEVSPEIQKFLATPGHKFQFHNYSPPPRQGFVLNLSSLDPETFDRSLEHARKTLELTKAMRLEKYAVHAGFFIPIEMNELGKTIKKRALYDKTEAYKKFVSTVNTLYEQEPERLYIENNVVSAANFKEYGENPFMLTCAQEYFELKAAVPGLKLLLDLAHLKVSCHTLGLNFEEEARTLCELTDYIHISDNNGLADSNQGVQPDSDMHRLLRQLPLSGKTITLEVYSGIEDLDTTYQLIKELIA